MKSVVQISGSCVISAITTATLGVHPFGEGADVYWTINIPAIIAWVGLVSLISTR